MVKAALMGLPHHQLATASSPVEKLLAETVITTAFDAWQDAREAQAKLIANEIAGRFT